MELVGIVAGLLELLAIYLVGIKNRYGFISGLISNLIWICFCLITQKSYGLLIVCPVAFFLNIKGFRNWKN